MINVHYLELFYYVAKHGGFGPAVRNIPYGIQQPALSSQIRELEQRLGTPLFHRRPFGLTVAGRELYPAAKTFFDEVARITKNLRANAADLVRMAASPVVFQHYLPAIVRTLRRSHPKLRFTLRAGTQSQIVQWLDAQEIDLAVTIRKGKPPAGCQSEFLIRLPLILLVPARSRWRSVEEILKLDPISEPLICPEENDVVARHFRQPLTKRGVDWPTGIEMAGFEVIESLVADGFGVGVSVVIPQRQRPRGLRALALKGWPPLEIEMIWRRRPNPLTLAVVEAFRMKAQALRKASD